MRLFASTATRRDFLLRLSIAAIILAGGTYLMWTRWPFLFTAEGIRTAVQGLGVFAPVGFILLQIGQVIFAPIPGHITGFAAGYIFGAPLGIAYSLTGIGIGSALAIGLSRRYGRPYVVRILDSAVVERLDRLSDTHSIVVFFVLFLVPGLPDDAICFVAGLTDIDMRKLVAVAVIGRAPAFILVALAGSNMAAGRTVTSGVLLVALALFSIIGFWEEREIEEMAS